MSGCKTKFFTFALLSILVFSQTTPISLKTNTLHTLSPTSTVSQASEQPTLNELLTSAQQALATGNWGELALLVPQLEQAHGKRFTAFNDTRGQQDTPPTEGELTLAEQYFNGEIHTSPFPTDFRPSRQEDVPLVTELNQDKQVLYLVRALSSLISGKGVFGVMSGGASSRMNVDEAPAEALAMAQQMTSSVEPKIYSKAAVPIGTTEAGKTFNFLSAFLMNIAKLQEQLSQLTGKPIRNQISIFTNNDYREELNAQLATQGNADLPTEDVVIYHQILGKQFYANQTDVDAVEAKEKTTFPEARKKAIWVEEQLAQGNRSAVIMEKEKSPLGHGDYVHHMISSGLIKKFIQDDVQWITSRNIDNAAGTFDFYWLLTLGRFLEEELDMQMEVSARKPGQKGGGLYVMQDGSHALNEDPAVKASEQKFLEERTAESWTQLDPKDDQLINGKKEIQLESFHMRTDGRRTLSIEEYTTLVAQDKVLVFKDTQNTLHFYERTLSQDSYWFNDAVAMFNLKYVWSIYGNEEQSFDEFKAEVLAADAIQLEAIAERGRRKFPTLIDPKPAKKEKGMIAIKRETNFWQGTSVADRSKIKIAAIGVIALSDVEAEFNQAVELGDNEALMELAYKLRMLATKKWVGNVESYESNKPWINFFLKIITQGDLIRKDILGTDELQFLSELESNTQATPLSEKELTAQLSQIIQAYIQHIRSIKSDSTANTTVAQSI